jgi:Zn-dependent alcohol dehydrogenase
MKDIGIVPLVVTIGLAVVASAVFAGGDRSILVAPAEAVAESFVRQLGMARYELARHFLASDVENRTSSEDLRGTFEPLRQHTGKPDQVETAISMTGDTTARVLVTLEGRRSTASMYIDLRREHGEWKVAKWPLDVVAR